MGDSIRIQPHGQAWQTLGAGGPVPDGVTATWDLHGPSTLSFDLAGVDQRLPALQLAEFVPVELIGDHGSDPVWGGSIVETPGRQAGLGVQAAGWQAELDRRPSPLFYVHDNLSDWVDARAVLENKLGLWRQAASVQTGQSVSISYAQAATIPASACAGVILDLGPDLVATAVAFKVGQIIGNPSATLVLYARATAQLDGDAGTSAFGYSDAVAAVPMTAGAVYRGTFTSTNRYVSLFLYYTGATAVTPGDTGCTIEWCRVFAVPGYDDGTGKSAVTASTVIRDQISRCHRLSTDYRRVGGTSLKIPALGGPGETATPKEAIERVDSYHRYRWGIAPDRRGYYLPQPATPALVVNTTDPGVEFTDASVNSSSDVRNEAVVTGRSGSGRDLKETLYTSSPRDREGLRQVNSPTMDTVTGWAVGNGQRSILAVGGVGNMLSLETTAAFPRTAWTYYQLPGLVFRAGVLYRARLNVRFGAGGAGERRLTFSVYDQDGVTVYATKYILTPTTPKGLLVPCDLIWRQPVDATNPVLDLKAGASVDLAAGTHMVGVDDLHLERPRATSADRAGIIQSSQLDVQAPTTPEAMRAIGEIHLNANSRPLFKGSLTVTGHVVTDRQTGRTLSPLEAASRAGELIDLADLIDPVTGDQGRAAVIAASTYSRGQAQLSLDTDRSSYQALQARMGLTTPR